jgi:hypothetical protein
MASDHRGTARRVKDPDSTFHRSVEEPAKGRHTATPVAEKPVFSRGSIVPNPQAPVNLNPADLEEEEDTEEVSEKSFQKCGVDLGYERLIATVRS